MNRQAIAMNSEGNLHAWHLATEIVLLGGLKAWFAWRLKSSARRYCCSRIGFCLLWCAWSTRFLWCLEVWLTGVPWVVAQNIFLELWLGIRVKHVSFLELWLKMTSLELWLKMADEHEKSFSCGSNWQVLPV